MSALSSAVPALAEAMKAQTDKLNEMLIVETLMATAGAQATGAWLQQLVSVKQATTAHAAAAGQLKQQQSAIQAWQKSLSDAGKTAAYAFNSAAEFSRGLAQAANPTAWSTMQDSLQLVYMQLGQAFLPTIIRVSIYAQEFAHWLHDLSPATKEWMTYLAGAGAALYLFAKAAAFANVITLGIPGKLLEMLGESLAKKFAVSGAGSGIDGVAGAAAGAAAGLAVVAGVCYALHERAKQMEQAWKDWETRIKETQEGKGITNEDVEKSQVYKAMDRPDRTEQEKLGIAMSERDELKKRQAEIYKELDAKSTGIGAGKNDSGWFGQANQEWNQKRIEELKSNALDVEKQLKINELAREQVVFGHRYVPKDSGETSTAAGRKAQQAATFLAHMPKEMQPRFSAVEEARKNFQLGALKDPLEQQKLAWERENNEALAKQIPQILKGIRDNTKDHGGVV